MNVKLYLQIFRDENLERSSYVRVFEKQSRLCQQESDRLKALGAIEESKKYEILAEEAKWCAIDVAQEEKSQGFAWQIGDPK